MALNWQMLHVVAAATLMSIVCGPAAAVLRTPSSGATTSALTSLTSTEVHDSPAHKNMAAHGSRVHQERQHQQHQFTAYDGFNQNYAAAKKSTRRSYSSPSATLNGLTSLSGLQHISNGYGTSGDASAAGAKQQIPIYEDQQEDDYGSTTGLTAAAGYAGENNQHGNNAVAADALRSAIYNLHSAGAHNDFLPSLGYGKSNSGDEATYSTSFAQSTSSSSAPYHQQSSDKISDGNFLHRYEQNSGYDELLAAQAATAYQPQQQQSYQQQLQQQQQQAYQQYQQQSSQYFTPAQPTSVSSYALDVDASAYDYKPSAPSAGFYDDSTNYNQVDNYPPQPSVEQSPPPPPSPPDIINYIPYPVVKKLHVPVHEPVQIPVSHAIIVPVSKPVPIHIPVPQQVQVPVEQELKIPIERVVPFPVERHVPVPVEKRVPYPVVKYVPVKVPRPYPVKVPVFKTILHKVKGWW